MSLALPSSAPTNMEAHIHAACYQFLRLVKESQTPEYLRDTVLCSVRTVMIYSWDSPHLFEGLDVEVEMQKYYVSLQFRSPLEELQRFMNSLNLEVRLSHISDDYVTD